MITNCNIEELKNKLNTYYGWYEREALISSEKEQAVKEFTECNRVINELWSSYQAYEDSSGERRWHSE